MLRVDKHNPSFCLLPINNARTAWKPFGLPVVLAVPYNDQQNGNILEMRISIKEVTNTLKVSGHDNIGRLYQDDEIYSIILDKMQLNSRIIEPENYPQIQHDQETYFKYTTSTQVTDQIQYQTSTTYYDLSDVQLEIETLLNGRYYISYQVRHYQRVTSKEYKNQLICINVDNIAISEFKLEINHPGEILYQFYKLTPQPYFTNSTKSLDTTTQLYRPFTDALQDIFDEQSLLSSINWVNNSPPEAIPYLSSLLGWDIPYFPESLDRLRQAVLKQTVKLQSLSGSRRSIISLFRLFGFEILVSNLWWSHDAKRLIRPNESLPPAYQQDQIQIREQFQVDLILNKYDKKGFNTISTTLLHRPQTTLTDNDYTTITDNGDVTIEAYLVDVQSPAYQILSQLTQQISDEPSTYAQNNQCYIDSNGFINCDAISQATNGLETIGFCQILLSGKVATPQHTLVVGKTPISQHTIKLDRISNQIHFTINQYLDRHAVFVLAYYKKQDIIVPEHLRNMQSNRFDIQVLNQNDGQQVNSTTLDFAIQFLDRLKSFHSLLNVIRIKLENTETYEVTGFCVGGDYAMRYDTDAGKLQVPPAIIPDLSQSQYNCALLDPKSIGYKDDDILLRLRKLTNLEEEYQAWKRLDTRTNAISPRLLLSQNQPTGDQCKYTRYGQDKISDNNTTITTSLEYSPKPNSARSSYNLNLSPVVIMNNGQFNGDMSSNSNYQQYSTFQVEYDQYADSICGDDGDFCYKARVADNIMYMLNNSNSETYQFKACNNTLGSGVYYSFPSRAILVIHGTSNPSYYSRTPRPIFSGGAKGSDRYYLQSVQTKYMTNFDSSTNSYMGNMYRSYSTPSSSTIHYNARIGLQSIDQRHNLALTRPSLNIHKPTLHIPGCRFATFGNLQSDVIHPSYMARPWDDEYSKMCNIGDKPSYLNATIVTISSEQFLQFDQTPFVARGNSLHADIPSLGDHVTGLDIDHYDVIHSVYSQHAYSTYVTLDQTCDYDTSVDGDKIETGDPLFSSHGQCGTSVTDYADGYRCEYGYFQYDQIDFPWYDILSAIGMTFNTQTGLMLLFRLSSGIRDIRQVNYRLDCGCLNACHTVPCNISKYGDDYNADSTQIESILSFDESLSVHDLRLDGSIPSLLETR